MKNVSLPVPAHLLVVRRHNQYWQLGAVCGLAASAAWKNKSGHATVVRGRLLSTNLGYPEHVSDYLKPALACASTAGNSQAIASSSSHAAMIDSAFARCRPTCCPV